jgi:tripartite ATP-independent transporter DctP family solute receptor
MKAKKILRILAAFSAACLLAIGLTACGGKSSSAGATSGDLGTYTIRVSGCNSLDHPQTLGLSVMKQYIEKETGGKITVNIYPNSQLGDEDESVQLVQDGALEMATASIGPITTFQKKFAVLDIPFLFTNYYEAWAALDSHIGTDLMDTLEEVGLKGLAYMENGFRHTTNSRKPINTLADYKGLKIRTMNAPFHIANFNALGANATPVPFSELYMAMAQKIVDGQENPLANIWELNLYEVQSYTSLTGHIYDAMPLVTNLNWFNKLPLEYQEIISKGAILGQNYSRSVNAGRENLIIEELPNHGMQVNDVTDAAKAEIKAISQPVVTEKVKAEVDPAFVDAFLTGINGVKADIVKSVK